MPAPVAAAGSAAAQAGAQVGRKVAGKASRRAATEPAKHAGRAASRAARKTAGATARQSAARTGRATRTGARRTGDDALKRARRAVGDTGSRAGGAGRRRDGWARRVVAAGDRSDELPEQVAVVDRAAGRGLRRTWRIVRRLPGISRLRRWTTLLLLLAVLFLFVVPLVFVVVDDGETAQAGVAALAATQSEASASVPGGLTGSGTVGPLGSTEPHRPGDVTATMQGVLDAVIPIFGRGYGIGCYDPSRSFGEHPLGRACDFLMADPLGQMPTSRDVDHGWGMANRLVENHEELGVWYVIWQDLIWSADRPDEGWVDYELYDGGCPTPDSTSSENGGDCHTLQHWDHIHVSVV